LHAGATKDITATFFTDKPSKANAVRVVCSIAKIRLPELTADWDDNMRVVRFVDRCALSPAQLPHAPIEERPKATARRMPAMQGSRSIARAVVANPVELPVQKAETTTVLAYQSPRGPDFDTMKVIEVREEPAFEPITGKSKDFALKVFAVADYVRYQTSTTDIEFSPTMMFETRIVEFKITNPSQIRFEYSWVVTKFAALRTTYAQYHASPFAVVPSSGFINAGQTTTFRATFSPEEVDDFSATMRCEIPCLDQMDPPELNLAGRSRRPICHFNLTPSDYISAGRRHPNYTEPLPEGVKVIEMFSHRIGQRTISKFEIINTTEAPYAFNWEKLSKTDDLVVQCNSPQAFISSGKRHVVSFSFTPVSVKTIESLWYFTIPEHDIHVYLLIVGRIMPY
jgi:hydrocephalus-inducing protein